MTVLYIFTLKRSSIFFAFLQMAFGRRAVRKLPGVTFAKLMGTGTGETFTPADANLHQWAILVVTDNFEALDQSPFIARWRARSEDSRFLLLRPISSHGKWSGVEPFTLSGESKTSGPVVAITRARLRWSQALRFWRSIPPVVDELHRAPGLIEKFGIGEAPIGLQGTYSLWSSGEALREFAYKGAAHRQAIADTKEFNWYSEELFARFEVMNTADFPHVH
jgi:hypothetical protein